jgi:3',5'-nucleoside bisphosphate phosphatase
LIVDLHAHSRFSDGVLSPIELVARAASRGVGMLALTDHDETGGLSEARNHAHALGVTLIDGVEISVSWGGQSVHVVGLMIERTHPDLEAGLAGLRSGREARAGAIAAELEKAGIPGTLEGARRYAANPGLLGRAHFARFLVERGHARDLQGVFRRYLAFGKPGYVPHQWASLGDALGWIRASGGVAVIAHPGRYGFDPPQRERLFAEFRDAGGAAVEIVTGSHSAEQVALYARMANKYGLLSSAGSDFHGPGEGRRDLGDVPELPPGCVPVWRGW